MDFWAVFVELHRAAAPKVCYFDQKCLKTTHKLYFMCKIGEKMGKVEIIFEKTLPKVKKFSEVRDGEFFVFEYAAHLLCQRLDNGHEYSEIRTGRKFVASALNSTVYVVDVRIFVELMPTD